MVQQDERIKSFGHLEELRKQFSDKGVKPNSLFEWLYSTDRAKRRVWANATVAHMYYQNMPYYEIDRQEFDVCVNDYLLADGFNNPTANQAIDAAHAFMMQIGLKPECFAPSGDRDAFHAATAGNRFLEDHWYRNKSTSRRRRMAKDMVIAGTSFLRHSWDPNQLVTVKVSPLELEIIERKAGIRPVIFNVISEEEIKAVMPMGGTVEHIVPMELVFVEQGPTDWSEVTRFAVVDYPSVRSARLKYPAAADKIKPMNVNNAKRSSAYNGGAMGQFSGQNNSQSPQTSFSEDQQVTMTVEFWVKDSMGWTMTVVTGDRFDVLLHEDRSVLHPYVYYGFKTTNSFWCKGLYEDMLEAQFAVNVMMAQQLSYFADSLKNIIFAPKGSNMSQLSNDMHIMVEYDPTVGVAPRIETTDQSVLQTMMAISSNLEQKIRSLGQMGDIGTGEVKARVSTANLQEVRDQATTSLMDVRQRMRDSESDAARIVLALNQQYADFPRLMGMYGTTNAEQYTKAFMGSDIIAGVDVQIIDTEETEKSKQERQSYAIQLMERVAPDMAAEQRVQFILDYTKTGETRALKPESVRQAEEEAINEGFLISSGAVDMLPVEAVQNGGVVEFNPNVLADLTGEFPVPLINPTQLHQVHIEEHRRQMFDPDTDPRTRQMLEYHVQFEHAAILAQQEEENRRMQIEFEREMSLARAAGSVATAQAQAEAQAAASTDMEVARAAIDQVTGRNEKGGGGGDSSTQMRTRSTGNPSQGGVESGVTRRGGL